MALRTTSPPTTTKQHCWECRRRRLVCDFGQPGCQRCRKAGVACPGYGAKKPLRWLEPGNAARSSARFWLPPAETDAGKAGERAEDAAFGGVCQEIVAGAGSRGSVQEVADALILPLFELQPLQAHQVRSVQVICYFNTCVYPTYAAASQLIPQLRVLELTREHLEDHTPAMSSILACSALGHRINQLPPDVCPRVLSDARSAYLRHRGESIRLLSDDVGVTGNEQQVVYMCTVALFWMVEVENGDPTWRVHCNGLIKLINMTGGIVRWLQVYPISQVMHHVINIETFSNATSPSHDLLAFNPYSTMIDIVSTVYDSSMTGNLVCPAPMVLAIIHINQIRRLAASNLIPPGEPAPPRPEELLKTIHDFSPEDWSHSFGTGGEELQSLGAIFQSAVALYCIISLEDVFVMQRQSTEMELQRAKQYTRLLSLLKQAIFSSQIKHIILWPFAVAGVAAVEGTSADRAFITVQLIKYQRFLGQTAPVRVREILERFWASGRTRWDDCFDKPCCFSA